MTSSEVAPDGKAEPAGADAVVVGYQIIGGWLCEPVGGHRCNCSGRSGMHEPNCGWEPLAKVADLLAEHASCVKVAAGPALPPVGPASSCSCNMNPATSTGPEQDCPAHGDVQLYAHWLEQASAALAVVAEAVRAFKDNDTAWQREWGWSVIDSIGAALPVRTKNTPVGPAVGIAALLSGEEAEAARHTLDDGAADLPGWRTSPAERGERP